MNQKNFLLYKSEIPEGQINNNPISTLQPSQSDCKSGKFFNFLGIASIVSKPFFLSLALASILLPLKASTIPAPPTPPLITGNTSTDVAEMHWYKVQFVSYLNALKDKGFNVPSDTAGILNPVDNQTGYITGSYITAAKDILNQIKQLNTNTSHPFKPAAAPSPAKEPIYLPQFIKDWLANGGNPNDFYTGYPMETIQAYVNQLATSPNNPWGDRVPNYDHVKLLMPPEPPAPTKNTAKDIDAMKWYKAQFLTYLNTLKDKGYKMPADTDSYLKSTDNTQGYTSGAYVEATKNLLNKVQELNLPTPPALPTFSRDLNQNAKLSTEFEKKFRGYLDKLRELGLVSTNMISVLQLQNNLDGFQSGLYAGVAQNIIKQAQQQANVQVNKPQPPTFPTLTNDNAKNTELIKTWQNSYQKYADQMNALGIKPVPQPPTFPTLTGDNAEDTKQINKWKDWYTAYVNQMKALGVEPIKVTLPSIPAATTPSKPTGTTTATAPSKPTTTATTPSKPTKPTGTTPASSGTQVATIASTTYASKTCNTNQVNCASFKFVSDGSATPSASDTLSLTFSPHYIFWNGTQPSRQSIPGGIYQMNLVGVVVTAPTMDFSNKNHSPMTLKDSTIVSNMTGSFNSLKLYSSAISGKITLMGKTNGGDHLYFYDSSKLDGDIINNTSTANTSSSVEFNNNSQLRGNIIVNSTASKSDMKISFTDSTWYSGVFQDVSAKNDFTTTINLTRSTINPSSSQASDFTFKNGKLVFNANESQINANLNLKNNATISLNKTDVNSIKVNAGTANITFDNSTISNGVEVNGGTANFTLSNKTDVNSIKVNAGTANFTLKNTIMNVDQIENKANLTIAADSNSHINTDITSGVDNNSASLNLYLENKTASKDNTNQRPRFTGKIVTNIEDSSYDKSHINMENSDLTLQAGSKLFVALRAEKGDNTLNMTDTLMRLTNASRFSGTLSAVGYNELEFHNSTFNLSDNSFFQGSLKTYYGSKGGLAGSAAKNTIKMGSDTLFILKPNANTSDINNASKFADLNIGFKGSLSTTGNNNYLEMDSSEASSNGDAVVLILKKVDQDKNIFNGTLQTKGNKNYLYLDSHTFNLNRDSFFDGVLTGKNNASFNNPNGDVVLENGSTFSGAIQANNLTLKGAVITNPSNFNFKNLRIESGTNEIKNITSSINSDNIIKAAGTLNMNFVGSSTDSSKAKPIAFQGNISTYADQTNLDFINTLYANPNGATIIAANRGINNISYYSELKTFQDPSMKKIIDSLPDKKPVFNILTQDNAQNNLGFSGVFSAKVNIFYQGGFTNIVLADALDPKSSLNFNNNTLASLPNGAINGRSYQNGLVIAINGNKANEILKDYRDIYANNLATLSVDKTSTLNDSSKTKQLVYKATLEGILIGDINSLPTNSSTSNRIYEATLGSNAAFIGSLEIKDAPIKLNLSQGSKVILTKDSTIENLSSTANFINTSTLDNVTLTQRNNTIVDLATNADYHSLSRKQNYSTLTIDNIQNTSNVVFRLSYGNNPNKNAPDSDKLIIKNALNSKDNYLQVYQNLSHPREIKEGEKVLLASVANGNNIENGKIFKTGKLFNNEGFDVIETNIVVLTENSPEDTAKATSKETYSNYYLTSTSSSINQEAVNISTAALNSNRSILLSNMNDINKRMGELRNNPASKGAWARIFNGMSTSNFGVELKNIFTNVQVGYDYSLGNLKDASQYLGVTVSYGYNSLNSNGAAIKGNANAVEVGLYYSYVGNNGFYSDSILKYAFINNQLSINADPSTDYNTNAVTFGQELGYRFFLDRNKRFYIDPAVEIILGYFGDGDISQTKQESFLGAKMDASFLYRVKAGGNIGYRLITARNETDFRAGLSYVLDGSTGSIDLNSNLSSQTSTIPTINSGVLQLGVNSMISDNWRFYMDLDVGFGSKIYRQDYLVSVGGRYLFGKKPKSVYNTTRPIRSAINPQSIETRMKSSKTQPRNVNQNGEENHRSKLN